MTFNLDRQPIALLIAVLLYMVLAFVFLIVTGPIGSIAMSSSMLAYVVSVAGILLLAGSTVIHFIYDK